MAFDLNNFFFLYFWSTATNALIYWQLLYDICVWTICLPVHGRAWCTGDRAPVHRRLCVRARPGRRRVPRGFAFFGVYILFSFIFFGETSETSLEHF